jgi:hypothetical protein
MQLYLITGTKHGAHIYAKTEGEARRIFHAYYRGESITHVAIGSMRNG